MNWTEPKPPTNGISGYDHVICETPLGKAIIERKGWKDSPGYDIQLSNEWVGVEDSLEEAKNKARQHLQDIKDKLEEFLLPPTEEDILQCKVCGGLYLGITNLYEHIDTVHNKGEEE